MAINFSAWIYAPALFVLWLAVLYSFKGILFKALRKWSEQGKHPWGEFLIKGFQLPL